MIGASVEVDGAGWTPDPAAGELLGVSPAMARLRSEIRAVARAGFRAVLVQGESGVGKEVVAEALRRSSRRASGPYEVFDCPAVPEDHLESELLGTARGAFPGAVDKRGALERAHGGTVFLDEVAAMRREHQAKILRVIEGKSFRRVGGTIGLTVDVAIIAAAHEDLAALAADGRFRHDLYYRLIRDGVLVIPPLRERPEDVPILVRDYLIRHGLGGLEAAPGALDLLAEFPWPGNVRQLHTALRVALRLEGDVLGSAGVEEALRRFGAGAVFARPRPPAPTVAGSPGGGGPDDRAVAGFHAITARAQRRALLQAYEAAAGNKTAAGVLLGFHLSPGERDDPERPLTDGRRNLALRKFRYWCARLGIAEATARGARARLGPAGRASRAVADGGEAELS